MTVLTSQAENIRDNFGYTAVFTPSSGSPVTLLVEYEEYAEQEPTGYDSTIKQKKQTIEFLKSDLAAEPNVDETFTIGAVVYKVKTIDLEDRWFMTVGVHT